MKLMIEYEIVSHDRIKDVRIFLNDIRMRSLHMHHDTELLLVLAGEGNVNIRNRKCPVSKGDCLLINAFESHEIIARNEKLTVLIIQYSNHFLRDYFPAIRNTVFNETKIAPFFSKEDYRDLIEDILKLSEVYFSADDFFELDCLRHLSSILKSLYSNVPFSALSEDDYSRKKKVDLRIERISSYIDANYQDPIRLKEIAENEGVSITHLSHLISKGFGMSFQDYLNEKRLACAIRLISDDSLSLSQIAETSGFSELKYMNKAFEDTFRMSAKAYRLQRPSSYDRNKKANAFEYIYPSVVSLSLIRSVAVDPLLRS